MFRVMNFTVDTTIAVATCSRELLISKLARNDSGTSEGTHPWVNATSEDFASWLVTFYSTEGDATSGANGIDSRLVSDDLTVSTP